MQNYLSLSDNFFESLDFEKSFEMTKKSLKYADHESKIDILFEAADRFSRISDYKKAFELYKMVINYEPENESGWYGMAFSNELSGGDLKFSIDCYEKAIELNDGYHEAYYYAAVLYDDLGDSKKAEEYLKKCIELDPSDYIAYNDLGSIFEHSKDYEKALYYLDKSIAIDDEYSLSHFNRGVVLKGMGKFDEALTEYEIANRYEINEKIYLNMSAIYIERKDYESAKKILTEGIERIPHHVLYYNRACVNMHLNDKNSAISDLKTALKIDSVVLKWAENDPDLKDINLEDL